MSMSAQQASNREWFGETRKGERRRRRPEGVSIVKAMRIYPVAPTSKKRRVATLLFYGLAGTLWGVPLLPLMSWAEGKPFLKKR